MSRHTEARYFSMEGRANVITLPYVRESWAMSTLSMKIVTALMKEICSMLLSGDSTS